MSGANDDWMMRARSRLGRQIGYSAMACSLVAAAVYALDMYVIRRNAYYSCTASPPPDGALPFESGYAGDGVVGFPVAGAECVWNSVDGTTFATVIPDPLATAMLWSAIALAAIGLTALAVSGVRRWISTPT